MRLAQRLLLLALAIGAAATVSAQSPDSCDWSQDAVARAAVKDREPSEASHYTKYGSSAQPKGVAWWLATACEQWQPAVPDGVTDDTDVIAGLEDKEVTLQGYVVAVKFERHEDHDLHFELSGKKEWAAAGHMIAEIPAGQAYCEARKALWAIVKDDENAKGDSFILKQPVRIRVTGFVFYDSHHKPKKCEDSGGRGIDQPNKGYPRQVMTVWELHPVIKVEKAE